jgi:hypothetical protein
MFLQTYRKACRSDSRRVKGGAQQGIRPHKHSTGHIRWFIRTVKLSQSEVEAKKRQNDNRNMSSCHSDAAKCNRTSKLKHFSDSKIDTITDSTDYKFLKDI